MEKSTQKLLLVNENEMSINLLSMLTLPPGTSVGHAKLAACTLGPLSTVELDDCQALLKLGTLKECC